MSNSALIVVDVQRDFCEGGALAVEGGLEVASRIADYIEHLGGLYDEIVFTKDWHEPWPRTNGGHFSDTPDFINSWPPHCEAYSEGSDFNVDIAVVTEWIAGTRNNWSYGTHVFHKGLGQPDYSGFQGHNGYRQSLHEFLKKSGIKNVDVVGIAGDYCVRHTAIDAKDMGFVVNVLTPMVASVRGLPGTSETLAMLASS